LLSPFVDRDVLAMLDRLPARCPEKTVTLTEAEFRDFDNRPGAMPV
jgi:hypothetical protein